MAARYWVGGTDTWDGTALLKWALTSGGVGGQAVPTSSDTVFFDANSGANTVTLGANANCSTLTMTGFTGTLAFSTFKISIAGNNATIYTGNSTFAVSGTKLLEFTYSGSTGTRTITPANTVEANALNISVTAGTDTVVIGNGALNIDFTGFSGILSNSARLIFGNLIISTGMTLTAGTNATTFSATSGTQAITTNAKTLDFPITFNGIGGTFQLQDAMTVGSTRIVSLTNGTLDLNGKNLTCGIFGSANSNTRTLAFGTGQIYLTGSGTTILNTATTTGLTLTGTPIVNCTYSGSVGTRQFSGGIITEANNPYSVNVTAGSDSFLLQNNLKNVNFTGFSGTMVGGSTTTHTAYGNYTLSSTMTVANATATTTFAASSATQTFISNGVTFDRPTVVSGTTNTLILADVLTLGSTQTFTLTSGTLNLNNKNLTCGIFGSSNSNTRTLAFGTGQIYLTGNSGTIWGVGTGTNMTISGTPIINATYSGSTGTRQVTQNSIASGNGTLPSVNISAGSDVLSFNGNFGSVDFTGFSGTLTYTGSFIIYGGTLKYSTGMTLSSNNVDTQFLGTGTTLITTNGKTIDFPLTFDGVGGTFQFQDVLTQGSTRTFTIVNGTVQLKSGVTSTVGSFATSGTNQKYLQSSLAGSQATLSQASGTVSVSYLTIQDIYATGGAIWLALTSNGNIDAGNNVNWEFVNFLAATVKFTRRKTKRYFL